MRIRLLAEKNNHIAFWKNANSHVTKFRVVAFGKPTILRIEPYTPHLHQSYTNTNPSAPSHFPHTESWLLKETTTSRSGYSLIFQRVAFFFRRPRRKVRFVAFVHLPERVVGYITATTRNFVTWPFAFFQNAMWLFFSAKSRIRKLCVT